jgi:hypothetical protein
MHEISSTRYHPTAIADAFPARNLILTRSIPALEGLPELQAFECRECGVIMTEAAKTEVFVRHLSATAHVDRRILTGLIRVLTKFVPRLRATPHALAPPAGTLPISFSTSLAALKASRPAGIPQ